MLGRTAPERLAVVLAQLVDEGFDYEVGGAKHGRLSKHVPMFLGEDVRVEAGLPFPSLARHPKILEPLEQELAHQLPLEVGIALAKVLGRFVAEQRGGAGLLELVEERRELA